MAEFIHLINTTVEDAQQSAPHRHGDTILLSFLLQAALVWMTHLSCSIRTLLALHIAETDMQRFSKLHSYLIS